MLRLRRSLEVVTCVLALAGCGVEVPAPDAELARSSHAALGGRPVHVRPRSLPQNAVPPPPAACTLKYYGGAVLSHVEVYDVRWGPQLDGTVTGSVPPFLRDVTRSAYLDWLSEYDTRGVATVDKLPGTSQGISRGSFAGSITITPSVCADGSACTLYDGQLGDELIAQINSGHLPPPSVGCDGEVNTLYLVEFPSNVSVDDGTGATTCMDFCAYHSTTSTGGLAVPYGVIPYMGPDSGCVTGCGSSVYRDRLTSAISHELVEAITDRDVGLGGSALARPVGWYAPGKSCGEIADLCTADGTIPSSDGGSWTVQTLWDNSSQSCVTLGTSAPLCAGGSTAFCQCVLDAGVRDAGTGVDGGQRDAGADAGPGDAGSSLDAGTRPDAGTPLDAGSDGGSSAYGGGTTGPTRDGGSIDGGLDSTSSKGCGCESGGALTSLAPLVLLWWRRRS